MRLSRGSLVAVLLTGLAMAATVVQAARADLPVVDDAAISAAYGRALYSGAGLRLTPASAPVEGFSSPLWVALTGLSLPLSTEPLEFARWLGIALGALALAFAALAVPAVSGRPLKPLDAVGPLLVASVPNYAYWICSGMESGLHSLLLVASVWAVARGFRLARGATAGAILGLLALTRPEAPLSIAAACASWGVWLSGARRAPGRAERRLAGTLALICGGYLAFRWGYFARLLPNTYYAKRSWDFRPEEYLLGFLRVHAVPLAVCLGLGLLGLTAATTRRAASSGLTFILCAAAFVCWVKGDWMGEWRFLSPLWPLFGVLAVSGLSALEGRVTSPRPTPHPEGPTASSSSPIERRRWITAPAAAGLLVVGVVFAAQAPRYRAMRSNPGFAAAFVMRQAESLGARLEAMGIARARLGMPDVGGLSLVLRQDRIVDLAGLADYAMAEHATNFRAIEDYLLSEGLPDVIDTHGPSRRLDRLSRVLDHYSWSEAGVWELSGISPGHDPRCPAGEVAPVLAAEAPLLFEQLKGLVERDEPEKAVLLLRCLQAHRLQGAVREQELAALSARALGSADRLERQGQLEPALRFLSLATILADENAHLRRRTERLRGRLFPPSRDSSDADDL